MTSRRQFLYAKSLALAALASGQSVAEAQDQTQNLQQNASPRDYWNDFPNYLSRKVNQARNKRKTELAALQSKEEADQRVAFVHKKVWSLIGGQPERTPLNPVISGIIDRDAYRIEKIIFESQPQFFVTAHLYIPKSSRGPFPGILAPVGHAPDGKAYSSYQTLFQNLARQGFAVLTWDPPGQGERLQYLDPKTNESLYGPTGEHDRFGWPAILIGSTTTQFESWDGIRALDYLLSRSEIDSARIGCCGHSGGGTQTMFLCALEPRIHVSVVVEGNTENLAGADYRPPGAFADAEQNIIGGLAVPLDRGDLLAAFAPKPLLICYTPIDVGTTYSPHYQLGTEEIVSELKNLYGVYGAQENVGLFNSTLPHDYDYFQRRATYQWFNKWLLNRPSAPEEVDCDEAPPATLLCTSTGQVLTSLGGRAAFQVNFDRLAAQRTKGDRSNREQTRKGLRDVLNVSGESTSLQSQVISRQKLRDVLVEEFQFNSEPDIRIPGWFLKPSSSESKHPVAVFIQDQGRDILFEEWPLIEKCVRAGIAVCSVDLRTCGVTRPRLPAEGPSFYGYGVELAYTLVSLVTGSPVLGQQTFDLLRCLEYLETRNDVDTSRIGICGSGTMGPACVAGAVMSDRVGSLLLKETLVDLASVVSSKEYNWPLSSMAFGLLPKFDLPELSTHVAPRHLWIVNAVGPTREQVPLSAIHARYSQTLRAYNDASTRDKLVMRVQPGSFDDTVLEWTRKTLA